jgi:hypothetical protein
LEPRIPCPPIFVNEPFAHYPPCPTPLYSAAIPPSVVAGSLLAIVVVVGALLLLALIAFSLTLGHD